VGHLRGVHQLGAQPNSAVHAGRGVIPGPFRFPGVAGSPAGWTYGVDPPHNHPEREPPIGDSYPLMVLNVIASMLALTGCLFAAGLADAVQPVWMLDPAYSGDGVNQTFFTTTGEDYAWAFGIAVQADGRIVAAGTLHYDIHGPHDGSADIAVARYLPDGTLDPSFDGDGRQIVAIGSYVEGFGLAIEHVGGQDKILVVGHAYVAGAPRHRMAVIRLNPDGSLDTDHDADPQVHLGHSGRLTFRFPGARAIARAVAVQPDGGIVVAGYVSIGAPEHDNFALLRLLPRTGALDPTFGQGGRVRINHSGLDTADSVAIQPGTAGHGPRIVFGGSTADPKGTDVVIGRLRLSGAIDPSFGVGGFRQTPLRGPRVIASYEGADGLAIDAQRRIVVASSKRVYGPDNNPTNIPAILRYTPDGQLDRGFAGHGIARIWPSPPQGYRRVATAVAIGPGNSIAWVGYREYAARGEPTRVEVGGFTGTGQPDMRFGPRGYRRISWGPGADEAYGVAFDALGRIVVAGIADTVNPLSVRAGFGTARLELH
jgi:uncharacterized delta-60 repeat protein